MRFSILFWVLVNTLIFVTQVKADEFTIFTVKPASPIVWTTPSLFAGSILYARGTQEITPVGHIMIELNCQATEEQPAFSVFDGMTSADEQEIMGKVTDGYGMGIFLLNYAGKLHGKSERENLNKLSCAKPKYWPMEETRVHFLKFKISSSVCRRMQDYYNEFKHRGIDRSYGGFLADPLRGGQAANCAVFATNFLEVGGLLSAEMQEKWYRSHIIPYYLIGDSEHRVNVNDILLKGVFWGIRDEDGVAFRVPDPDLVYTWIQDKYSQNSFLNAEDFQRLRYCDYSKGIVFDATELESDQGPIFK